MCAGRAGLGTDPTRKSADPPGQAGAEGGPTGGVLEGSEDGRRVPGSGTYRGRRRRGEGARVPAGQRGGGGRSAPRGPRRVFGEPVVRKEKVRGAVGPYVRKRETLNPRRRERTGTERKGRARGDQTDALEALLDKIRPYSLDLPRGLWSIGI